MTTYRCASCGSPNVMTDTQAGGVSYDYKKGIIGTVVLGPGGAVAGVSSKSQTVYKCADCGMCLTYSMPDDLRLAIDMGVNNADMRNQVHLINDSRLSWNRLKQLYKNIESGYGDQQIERKESFERKNLLSYSTATQEEFDHAVDTLVDFENNMKSCDGKKHLSLSEYYVWQDALYTFIENAVKYLPKKLPEQYRGLYLGTTNADSPHRNASRMLCYFFTYFVEKVALENGGAITRQQMKDYAEYTPFILLFINWFFMRHFVPFGGGQEQDIPYTEDNFHELFRWTSMPAKNIHLCFREITPKVNGQDTRTVYLPPYLVKNSVLGHWLFTGQTYRQKFNEEFADDYWRYNPEKKAEFEKRIAEKNRSIDDKIAEKRRIITDKNSNISEIRGRRAGLAAEKYGYEQEIESNKFKISKNNTAIEEKKASIESLRKKFFGKKAARAEADNLEQSIPSILQENEKYAQEISNCQKRIDELNAKVKQAEKETQAVEAEIQEANKEIQEAEKEKSCIPDSLLRDMDYFIFWHWDCDEFRKMLEERELAEKRAQQNAHESSRYYYSIEGQNARKKIEEVGIQRTDSIETDICNYLAIVKVATTNDLTTVFTGVSSISMFKILTAMAHNGSVERHTYDTTYCMLPGQFTD